MTKQGTNEETKLRRQFEVVLSLRRSSRAAERDAKGQSGKCESEWLKLKKMLRAGS
jgi:hypothetical protein